MGECCAEMDRDPTPVATFDEDAHAAEAVTAETAEAPAEAALALRVRQGEPGAEDEFATSYRRRVFAVVLARLGDFDAAQDVTQETLLRVLGALRAGRLEHPDKLGAFVCGAARNLASNHLRARRHDADVRLSTLVSKEEDPEQQCSQHEHAVLARQALGALDLVDRKILLWSLVDGLVSDEIGRRLGLRAATVRQRKLRALQKARLKVIAMSQTPDSRY